MVSCGVILGSLRSLPTGLRSLILRWLLCCSHFGLGPMFSLYGCLFSLGGLVPRIFLLLSELICRSTVRFPSSKGDGAKALFSDGRIIFWPWTLFGIRPAAKVWPTTWRYI
jgi:hypothetical protein